MDKLIKKVKLTANEGGGLLMIDDYEKIFTEYYKNSEYKKKVELIYNSIFTDKAIEAAKNGHSEFVISINDWDIYDPKGIVRDVKYDHKKIFEMAMVDISKKISEKITMVLENEEAIFIYYNNV
jgi:hypothetical protein